MDVLTTIGVSKRMSVHVLFLSKLTDPILLEALFSLLIRHIAEHLVPPLPRCSTPGLRKTVFTEGDGTEREW